MIDFAKITETNETYHSSEGLSFTGLKKFAETPAHYAWYKANPNDETSSQKLGTLAHMAILEPMRFETGVKIVDGHRGSNSVRAAVAAAEEAGYYVCKPEEYQAAIEARNAVKSLKVCSALFEGGYAEKSIRFVDEKLGLLLKCRPDYIIPSKQIIVDIKTFNDLSDHAIDRQIHRMKYHWQSAFYLNVVNQVMGWNTRKFVHVFVHTEVPVARAKVLDDASLEKAREEMQPLLVKFAECLKTNSWPGYADEITEASLPSYAWEL